MRIRILAGAAALAMLGACTPQLYFAQGPGACAPMQQAAHHRTSVMATTQRVHALQSKLSLTSRYAARSSNEGWRQAATGECR
jgi:hypothetical protein